MRSAFAMRSKHTARSTVLHKKESASAMETLFLIEAYRSGLIDPIDCCARTCTKTPSQAGGLPNNLESRSLPSQRARCGLALKTRSA